MRAYRQLPLASAARLQSSKHHAICTSIQQLAAVKACKQDNLERQVTPQSTILTLLSPDGISWLLASSMDFSSAWERLDCNWSLTFHNFSLCNCRKEGMNNVCLAKWSCWLVSHTLRKYHKSHPNRKYLDLRARTAMQSVPFYTETDIHICACSDVQYKGQNFSTEVTISTFFLIQTLFKGWI